jgi:hypothetical protein
MGSESATDPVLFGRVATPYGFGEGRTRVDLPPPLLPNVAGVTGSGVCPLPKPAGRIYEPTGPTHGSTGHFPTMSLADMQPSLEKRGMSGMNLGI